MAPPYLPSFMLRVKPLLCQTGRWQRFCVVTSLEEPSWRKGPPGFDVVVLVANLVRFCRRRAEVITVLLMCFEGGLLTHRVVGGMASTAVIGIAVG